MPGSRGRRFQASIETELPCELVGPGASGRGAMVSFALGEVALALTQGGALEGDLVKLKVELPGGLEKVEFEGIVSRLSSAADGQVHCGVRIAGNAEGERAAGLELLERLLQTPAPGRRRTPRVVRPSRVTCEADEQFEADLVDISRAGLALQGRLPLKEGDTVTVGVDQPSPHELRPPRLSGRVVYVRRLSDTESRAGVHFEGLDEGQKRTLADYLRALMRHG